MAISRSLWVALGFAAVFAGAMPAVLLSRPAVEPVPADTLAMRPIVAAPVAPVAAVYERNLFAPAEAERATSADAPALVGIAGRLNRDAIAMVRLSDGSARSLAIGESVEGWRLESLAIDAAFFTRGRERVRVGIASDEAPADQ